MRQVPVLAVLATALTTVSGAASAQSFSLEGAVIDSRTSQSLGVVTERGDINGVFRAQKSMTFGILRSAGISLEQLPPDIRARIERFQTTNVEAFRAFSQGLDLKDQGKFAEARELFRRAAELDPGFALASEQQRSMPDVNLGGAIQIRSVMLAAAGAAVDRGKASYVVDVARAMAAIQAGQVVVAVTSAPTEKRAEAATIDYTVNPPGSSTQFSPNLVVGLSYTYANTPTTDLSIATSNEWRGDKYRVANGVLESVGASGEFLAQQLNAAAGNQGNATLADGSAVYWGSWLSTPTASAAVTAGGTALLSPRLGLVDYMYGDATQQMPTANTAVFSPRDTLGNPTGMLGNPSGTIAVNFATRDVTLQNLGFNIGGLAFSGLNGSTRYDANIASGYFTGNYTSGSCQGCTAFTPQSSNYGGSFVGRDANGLIFSTILLTGNPTGATTASGVQLFTRP
jgi:hypothetical protein